MYPIISLLEWVRGSADCGQSQAAKFAGTHSSVWASFLSSPEADDPKKAPIKPEASVLGDRVPGRYGAIYD